jgi:molybdenum cofactor cytidylyltransferase
MIPFLRRQKPAHSQGTSASADSCVRKRLPEMKFGSHALNDALGAILAHSIVVGSGTLKKGRTLSADDIAALRAAGHSTIVAARLEPDDVSEDDAARRIAAALTGANVTAQAPFTGRANLFAAAAGLVQFDAERLIALNAIDERITIATTGANERVAKAQMIATIKIIPFAVPETVLARADAIAANATLSVAPFTPHPAALILTEVAQTKPNILAKRARVIADRLDNLGSTLAATCTVPHDATRVAAALQDAANRGHNPILIFAASAIVDRGDVVPAGLIKAGGTIERLGMPVDPGNLLLLGRLGNADVIGIPSCAASPKLNGFDWVLERTLAGVAIASSDIARMGIGGLLKEIPTRPQPRAGEDNRARDDGERRAPRIACIVLAAGRSTRMGANNKLVENLRGKPIVRHAVDAALASAADPIVGLRCRRPSARRPPCHPHPQSGLRRGPREFAPRRHRSPAG